MTTNPEESTHGRTIALTGVFLQVATILSTIGTVLGMRHAFSILHASPTGISDPRQLASAIGDVLIITAIGVGIGLIGLVLLCIALLGSRYRAEWFFWFLVLYGTLMVFTFPIGTLFGIFFLIYCLTRRHEFLKPTIPEFHHVA
jgi:multisubunit Na+/H+ antiporter MnhC subunit